MFCYIYCNFGLFSDIEQEGEWRHKYTSEEVEPSTNFGTIAGGRMKNCGMLLPGVQGWQDWMCSLGTSKGAPVLCVCEHPTQMYLTLRGLCPDSNIDQFYVPRNKERSGSVILVGFVSTVIEYDKAKLLWKLSEYFDKTTATSEAPLASFALGSHEWRIENDALECPKGEKRILKLTGCFEGEFTCSSGECIRE